MHHGPRHHHGPVGLGVERVGHHPRAVHDGHRAPPDDLQRVVGEHDGRGVLVQAQAHQRGRLGHHRQQPPQPGPLLEVLIHHHALEQSEARGHLGHPVLGRGSGRPERHHVGGHGAGPGGGPRDHGTPLPSRDQRCSQRRPHHHRRQPELVPSGQEDPGGPLDDVGHGTVVRVIPGHRPQSPYLGCPQAGEQARVQLGGLVPQAGGGGHDHDTGVRATGQLDEPAQDDLVPELVLGAPDDHDRPGSGVPSGRFLVPSGSLRHGPQSTGASAPEPAVPAPIGPSRLRGCVRGTELAVAAAGPGTGGSVRPLSGEGRATAPPIMAGPARSVGRR